MAETIQIRPVEPEDWPDITEMMRQPRVIAGTLQLPFRGKFLEPTLVVVAGAQLLVLLFLRFFLVLGLCRRTLFFLVCRL